MREEKEEEKEGQRKAMAEMLLGWEAARELFAVTRARAASLDLLALHDPCSKCVRIFTCTRMDGYAELFFFINCTLQTARQPAAYQSQHVLVMPAHDLLEPIRFRARCSAPHMRRQNSGQFCQGAALIAAQVPTKVRGTCLSSSPTNHKISILVCFTASLSSTFP